MVEILQVDILPWLTRFGSRPVILAELESAEVDSHELSTEGPGRLLATRMRLAAGDREKAQQHLDAWASHCSSRTPSEPHLLGHLSYLVDFATRVGLRPPNPNL